jgi:conjugal transfer mating pair stabilization protein TraG
MITAIFNMIAMVCNNSSLIFGAAILAGAFKISAHSLSYGHLRSTLASAAVDALVVPMIIALTLTSGSLKTNLTVESTISGSLTSIANVPIVIAIVPVVASHVGQTVGAAVETAFNGVNTSYPLISASGTGFLNPLRILVATRTAVNDLGIIPSQISTVVSTCVNTDSGLDLSAVQSSVMDVSNSGVPPEQTLAINNVTGTGVGALLWAATQSSGTVTSMADITGGGAPQANPSIPMVPCAQAAQMVANNISFALNSKNFARVVQGSIQASDNPIQNPGAANPYTLDALSAKYSAIRNPNAITAAVGGQTQANTEMMNLLFSEMVEQQLDCLSLSGSNKTLCQSDILTRTELERKALKDAANANIAMKYLGIFSNDLLAILIGLGPVLFVVMMFMGEGFAKPLNAWVQMILWPILMSEVGAELINGIMYFKVATFFQSMSQGGTISQSLAYNAYTELANQISMASSLMGGLPQLMGVIFALGGSAALNSVANEISSGQTDAADSLAAPLQNSAPIVSQSSVANTTQGLRDASTIINGQVDPVHASMNSNMANSLNNTISESQSQSKTNTEDMKFTNAITKGSSHSETNGLKLSEGLQSYYEESLKKGSGESSDQSSSNSNSSNNQTSNSASTNAKISFGLGVGLSGPSANMGGSLDRHTGATDTDTSSSAKETAQRNAISENTNRDRALRETRSHANDQSFGEEDRKYLDHAISGNTAIGETITNADSKTNAQVRGEEASQRMSLFTQDGIKMQQLATGFATNQAFRSYENTAGNDWGRSHSREIGEQEKRYESGAVSQLSGSNIPKGLIYRHMAAQTVAMSPNASPEERMAAGAYLGSATSILMGSTGLKATDENSKNLHIAQPATNPMLSGERLMQTVKANALGAVNPLVPRVSSAPQGVLSGSFDDSKSISAPEKADSRHVQQDVLGGFHESSRLNLGPNAIPSDNRINKTVLRNLSEKIEEEKAKLF